MNFSRFLLMMVYFLVPTYVLVNPASLAATAHTAPSKFAKAATPAAKNSTFYRFERFSLSSADQQRHYQITLAIPKVAMPASGYPVLYMLDGNAALPLLTDEVFARLQGADWPVIVTLGYEADARTARLYDYTPTLIDKTRAPDISQFTGRSRNKPTVDKPIGDQRSDAKSYGGENYGGAEPFWQFIEQAVKPQVARRVSLDMARQSLWGHSFGGLFVLHTLFNHPESFQTYIAVDPSLWWQQGQLLNAEAGYQQRGERPHGQVLIQSSSSRREGSTLPDDAVRRLAQRLSQLPELTVQYYDYFQHHHGSVRAASIPAALRMAQGIEQQ